jgi:chorismate mutase / prephenate dehydratase
MSEPEAPAEPVPPSAPEPIEQIRAQIDAVDRQLLGLIAERLRLADGLAGLKNGAGSALPIRPGREVLLLRALIAAAPEPVEPDLVVEIWRALIAANVRRQGPVDVAVAGGKDPVRLFDAARRHFGARTRIERVADPQSALMRAAENPRTLAVAPWPAAAGVGGWWPALSESRFAKLFLIAALPIRERGAEIPEAAVFAAQRPEPVGGAATILIAFDPHHRVQRALNEAGLAGRELARSEPRSLLQVEGFVGENDVAAGVLARAGLDGVRIVGSFARV